MFLSKVKKQPKLTKLKNWIIISIGEKQGIPPKKRDTKGYTFKFKRNMFWIKPNLSSVVKHVKPQCNTHVITVNYQRCGYVTRAKLEGKNTKLEVGKMRGNLMQSAPVQSLLF